MDHQDGSDIDVGDAGITSQEVKPDAEAKVLDEDAMLADFMAELREARERIAPDDSSDTIDQSFAKAVSSVEIRMSVPTDTALARNATAVISKQTEHAHVENTNVCVSATTSAPLEFEQSPPRNRSRRQPRQRHIKNMSVLSVSQTLKTMGLPYVAKVFEDENIDGAIAQFLDDDLLRNQLKILTISERQKTLNWISTFYSE
jgi:hypothetical protein